MNKDYNYYLSAALKFTRNKEDAEDVLQQTILQTLNNTSVITHWDTYFYKALYNSSVIYNQKKRRAQRFNDLETGIQAEIFYRPYPEIDQEELDALKKAIAKLTEKQKEAIEHFLKEIPFSKFKSNENTIRQNYIAALKQLKVILTTGKSNTIAESKEYLKNEINLLREQGKSFPFISRKLGISIATAYKWSNKN